tara:strand:+ start:3139 stop:4554 length:1416 start_codon:yes stop_codon:yes gene_type:complete
MARGIKSDYVRAAEEEGKFQHSMAEAMSQDDILKTRQAKLGVKEDIKQSWRDFGAEALVTGELLINKLRDRTLVEKGVAELEKRTGYTMNFQKDSLLDVLSGKSDFKNIFRKQYKLGGRDYTEEDLIAIGKLGEQRKHDHLFTDDEGNLQEYKGEASGWKYGQESLPVTGSQREGMQLQLVGDDDIGYQVGGRIYGGSRFTGEDFEGKTLKGRGLGEWETKHLVYEDYWKSQFQNEEDRQAFEEIAMRLSKDPKSLRAFTDFEDQIEDEYKIEMSSKNISYADYIDYKKLQSVIKDDMSTEKEKEAANIRLNVLYRELSDKVEWKEMSEYIANREGIAIEGGGWEIGVNKEGLGYDIGKYQINTGWLLPNDMGGLWEKTKEGGNYALYDMVNSYLDDIVSDKPIQEDTRYYGMRKGFDAGDLFGEDTIFNKYRNKESINPFKDDEEANKRREQLMEEGIIDENYNVYKTNT